jgi:lipopolysaccharide biosynthesis glycosyltransferase
MTLRHLAEQSLRSPSQRPSTPRRSADPATSALAFVLDSSFVVGLKTLAFSMIKQDTLVDLPVIVLSNDAAVTDDPFVHALADHVVRISPHDVSRFDGISAELVREQLRLDWIPKYTFLKWLIFDDWGVDQLIWIDADVLCTGKVDHLTELRDQELYAAEVFQKSMHSTDDGEGDLLPIEQRESNILRHANVEVPPGPTLNSGVMVINRPLLDRAFQHELIATATAQPFENEQQVVRTVLERRGTRGWLSPLDNFHHNYVKQISAPAQEDLLARVRLLHYVGRINKPWLRGRRHLATSRLWWAAHDEAVASSDLFREP